jgi:hypothetical protein
MAHSDAVADQPLCFAIMPITTPPEVLDKYGNDPTHFLRVARHIIKPAVEAAGFEFRAPASTSSEIIQAEIIENLEKAKLVVCDISQWNPNVFFELGIRVALDRPVAMIKDSLTYSMPFDTAMLNCHTYDSSLDITRVEAEIPKLKNYILNAKSQTRNALWKFFGLTKRAEEPVTDDSESTRSEYLLAEVRILQRMMASIVPYEVRTPTPQTSKPNLYALARERDRQKFERKAWIYGVADAIGVHVFATSGAETMPTIYVNGRVGEVDTYRQLLRQYMPVDVLDFRVTTDQPAY